MIDQLTFLIMQARKKGFDPVYALVANDSLHLLKSNDECDQAYEKTRQRWRDILTA